MSKNPKIGPVWVTKYAPTKGIVRYESAEHCIGISDDMIEVGDRWKSHYHKGEWFFSEEAAQRNATDRIQRKVASMEKQIVKLKHLARDGCFIVKGE